jgi:hypothetical protein
MRKAISLQETDWNKIFKNQKKISESGVEKCFKLILIFS